MKYKFYCLWLLGIKLSYACTSFGMVTASETILGKNRDYTYDKQDFALVNPIKQFTFWYNNPYHHQYKFYALMSNNDVKMGVNEVGLTAIEEDPPYPHMVSFNRRYYQPVNGNAEGMVLYGLLQNFATVKEITPYLNEIFSVAAPNFYQIADGQQILSVEVGYGASASAESRPFTYQIINTPNSHIVHTNTYLSPQFISLNDLQLNKNILLASQYRLETMNKLIQEKPITLNQVFNWFMVTKSTLGSTTDSNWCENTSIFRSNLQGLKQVSTNGLSNLSVYGTVSNMVVVNTNNLNSSLVYLRMIDSIKVLKNGKQQIKYQETLIPLAKLFKTKHLKFSHKLLVRAAPKNGICK